MGWTLLVLALLGLCRADSELKCDNATLHLVPGCLYGCPPERTCQNFRGPEPPCVPPTAPCKPQCVCADGYAKNQYGGTCVTFEQCDKCPGYNQYFACDGPYSETCPGSCHCASGYERDANNTCVSTTPPPVDPHPHPPPPPNPPVVRPSPANPPILNPSSPPIRDQVNWPPKPQPICNNVTKHEVPACTYGCPPERTCQNRNWPPLPCARPIFPCTPKCICDNGYARNQPGGTCVTIEQCDKCPGENEYFECDGKYSEDCIGHCCCFSNHVRDTNDKCVYVDPASPPQILDPPVEETTEPPPICNNVTKHEVPGCTYGCPPEVTCQNRNWPPFPCAPPGFLCTPKCICDDGYVRNQPDGRCVTLEQCDKCPGENEYFECDCEYSEDCIGHCYCFSNHVRDLDGKCVYVDPASPPEILVPPIEAMTEPPPICNNVTKHEVPGCTHICPPEVTCQNRNWLPYPCAPPGFPCTPKCVCDDGYVRNQPDGTCVTLEQCDKCPGENEYFECDCEYSEDCIGHCYCFSNHVRDLDGKCVYVDPASPPKILDPPVEDHAPLPPIHGQPPSAQPV